MADSKSSALEIRTDRSGDDATLSVTGEVDLETSRDLSDALAAVQDCRRVHLDLGNVEYMDSTGLRTLLVAKEATERDGGVLDITAASNIVTRLIEITGVSGLMADPPVA